MTAYEVLGVGENADRDEMRRAYLQAIKKYHPDQYKDNPLKDLAEERLKQINEAYALLCEGSARDNRPNEQESSYSRQQENYQERTREQEAGKFHQDRKDRAYRERAYVEYKSRSEGCADCCCCSLCCCDCCC